MKLLVGLGNPGQKYLFTRHNAGFMAVDALAHELKEKWKSWGSNKNAEIIQATLDGHKIVLLKPLTFMNVSGPAVAAVAGFFKIEPEDICVVHDELDLEFGVVRLKIGGGEGGHNGLKSVTSSLSTGAYSRIRLGVGRPPNPHVEAADFVLQNFDGSEMDDLSDMLSRACEGLAAFAAGPQAFKLAMNRLHTEK